MSYFFGLRMFRFRPPIRRTVLSVPFGSKIPAPISGKRDREAHLSGKVSEKPEWETSTCGGITRPSAHPGQTRGIYGGVVLLYVCWL